jgi:hypothetical protein
MSVYLAIGLLISLAMALYDRANQARQHPPSPPLAASRVSSFMIATLDSRITSLDPRSSSLHSQTTEFGTRTPSRP